MQPSETFLSITPLLSVFLASLLGSLHCVGMCGGFVAFVSANRDSKHSTIAPQVLYHFGRLLTYVVLGLTAGALGNTFDEVGIDLGLGHFMGLVTGLILVAWGGLSLWRPNALPINDPLEGRLFQFVRPLYGWLLGRGAENGSGQRNPVRWPLRAFILGSSSTFLPCGWLYMFVILAAASGGALRGALTMAVFWLGTVPILTSFGGLIRLLSAPLRRYVPRVTAGLLLVAGLWSIGIHLGAVGAHNHAHHHGPSKGETERSHHVHEHGTGM